jgi:hypothetical protein
MDTAITQSDLLDLETLITPEMTERLLRESTGILDPVDEVRKSLSDNGASLNAVARTIAFVMNDSGQRGMTRLNAAKLVLQIQGIDTEARPSPVFSNTIVLHGDQERAMAVIQPRKQNVQIDI